MKKIITGSLAALVAVFMFASCGKSDKAIVKENAEQFLTALTAGDFAKAKAMVTPETDAKWGDLLMEIDQTLSPEAKQAIANAKLAVQDVKINGEEAEVTCTAAIPYLVANTTILHFKKVGENWLVNEPDALVTEVLESKTVVLDNIDLTEGEQEAAPAEEPAAPVIKK